MKTQFVFLFTFILISNFIFCQEQVSDNKKTESNPPLIGIYSGLIFSKLEVYNLNTDGKNYENVNEYKPGMSVGISFSPLLSKYFYLQFGINTDIIQHRIIYFSHFSGGHWGSDIYEIGDYKLTAFLIRPSAMAKFQFGKKIKILFGAGGYFDIPAYKTICGEILDSGQSANIQPGNIYPTPEYFYQITKNNDIKLKLNQTLGLLFSIGTIFPVKNRQIGIELYYIKSSDELIYDFGLKQDILLINLSYNFNLKPHTQ